MYLMQIGWGLERKQYKFQQAYKRIKMLGNVLPKESFQTIQLIEKGLNFFDLSVSTAYQAPDTWYILSLTKLYAMDCNIDVKITRKQKELFYLRNFEMFFFPQFELPPRV